LGAQNSWSFSSIPLFLPLFLPRSTPYVHLSRKRESASDSMKNPQEFSEYHISSGFGEKFLMNIIRNKK